MWIQCNGLKIPLDSISNQDLLGGCIKSQSLYPCGILTLKYQEVEYAIKTQNKITCLSLEIYIVGLNESWNVHAGREIGRR
jgi:hypothetical protein